MALHVPIQHVVFFLCRNNRYCKWYHDAPLGANHGLSHVGLDGAIALFSIVEEANREKSPAFHNGWDHL